MKKYHLIILLLLFIIPGFAQNKPTGSGKQHKVSEKKPEETIQQYFFVMLSKGPNRAQDSATAAKIQEGHLANIKKLYNEGKLKVAGPFGDDGNWRGIFIFDCKTEEEVKQLLNTDPAIRSGRLVYEIHPWYTSPIGSFKPGKPE
ncbi:MAG TPA: YciI family protein [Chitinophagaceae bacterium]|nr:YciI family protein [Chitinophagaceae bacterium]